MPHLGSIFRSDLVVAGYENARFLIDNTREDDNEDRGGQMLPKPVRIQEIQPWSLRWP